MNLAGYDQSLQVHGHVVFAQPPRSPLHAAGIELSENTDAFPFSPRGNTVLGTAKHSYGSRTSEGDSAIRTESEIPIHDGVKLELAQRSNTRSWTSGMEEAHLQLIRLKQIKAICGIEAYAHLLQGTLEKLVKLTAGNPAQSRNQGAEFAPRGYRKIEDPKAPELKCFCIQALQSPVKYPVVCASWKGHHKKYHHQFILVRYQEVALEANHVVNGDHRVVFAAGPRFIRSQSVKSKNGIIGFRAPTWPTLYGTTTLPDVLSQDKAATFGAHAHFIKVTSDAPQCMESTSDIAHIKWGDLIPHKPLLRLGLATALTGQ
ncbi:hypothetical protein C6P46_006611 [Rhodotorula mucilaginosa]|uniref:Uncharacterized protein n=1 Tax=Rhodotorula mucilaginosa TaxID=5537 RepID=A0A9P6VWT9_RHOMI|nr:hypothetical protein C6P46_006611 [Rhodotorula mucilaginosa]